MLTLRRRSPLDDVTVAPSAGRPVLLATLDVPFSEEAAAFAVDSAVESGQPLLLVNVAEVLPTVYSFLGYGYVEREHLQDALRKPAELAHSLAVRVERLRVCSPHPVDALLEVRHPAWEHTETIDAIWRAVGALSVDLKMALLLRDVVGLSYDEIAETLQVTLATVKWRIYTARESVQRALSSEGIVVTTARKRAARGRQVADSTG